VDEGQVGEMLRQTLIVMLKLAGPPLLLSLVVGLLIALVQAVTQINEQALTFVPKVLTICVSLLLLGSFMMSTLSDYTHMLFDKLVAIGGS
jgi:flagellar biosynthetic protein FliQ